MKKLMAKGLATLMICSVLPSASAANAILEPFRYEPCPNCQKGFVSYGYIVLKTENGLQRPCEHGHYNSIDKAYREYRKPKAECTSCSWEWVATDDEAYWTDWGLYCFYDNSIHW